MKFQYLMPILALGLINFSACNKSDALRSDIFDLQRENMVRWDLESRGIKDKDVLGAMKKVPRHLFLLEQDQENAYLDNDLPIGHFQTTPRPFVVAKTIELLKLKRTDKVLEVGTGLGYQSALLGELAQEVYTIEIVPDVARKAESLLKLLNYQNVYCRIGDGYKGWPDRAPFDAVMVMASAKSVPGPLLDQLKMGGRLVMPIESSAGEQELVLYRKQKSGLRKEQIMPVQFKPMEGRAAGRYW